MSRNEPAIEIWSDDYWSPEEREAWDAAIERNILQRPPRTLRRAQRDVLAVSLRNLKPITPEARARLGFPFNVPTGADEEE